MRRKYAESHLIIYLLLLRQMGIVRGVPEDPSNHPEHKNKIKLNMKGPDGKDKYIQLSVSDIRLTDPMIPLHDANGDFGIDPGYFSEELDILDENSLGEIVIETEPEIFHVAEENKSNFSDDNNENLRDHHTPELIHRSKESIESSSNILLDSEVKFNPEKHMSPLIENKDPAQLITGTLEDDSDVVIISDQFEYNKEIEVNETKLSISVLEPRNEVSHEKETREEIRERVGIVDESEIYPDDTYDLSDVVWNTSSSLRSVTDAAQLNISALKESNGELEMVSEIINEKMPMGNQSLTMNATSISEDTIKASEFTNFKDVVASVATLSGPKISQEVQEHDDWVPEKSIGADMVDDISVSTENDKTTDFNPVSIVGHYELESDAGVIRSNQNQSIGEISTSTQADNITHGLVQSAELENSAATKVQSSRNLTKDFNTIVPFSNGYLEFSSIPSSDSVNGKFSGSSDEKADAEESIIVADPIIESKYHLDANLQPKVQNPGADEGDTSTEKMKVSDVDEQAALPNAGTTENVANEETEIRNTKERSMSATIGDSEFESLSKDDAREDNHIENGTITASAQEEAKSASGDKALESGDKGLESEIDEKEGNRDNESIPAEIVNVDWTVKKFDEPVESGHLTEGNKIAAEPSIEIPIISVPLPLKKPLKKPDDFLSGLDGFEKFLEHVDAPEELDVAAGSSMQDVLIQKGTQILKKNVVGGAKLVGRETKKVLDILRRKVDELVETNKALSVMKDKSLVQGIKIVKVSKKFILDTRRKLEAIRLLDKAKEVFEKFKNLFGNASNEFSESSEDEELQVLINKLRERPTINADSIPVPEKANRVIDEEMFAKIKAGRARA